MDPRRWNRRQLVQGGGALGLAAMVGRAAGGATAAGDPALTKAAPVLANRVDDLAAPGREDFERRVEAAQRALAAADLGALVVEATSSLGYFTGVRWWPSERVFAVVIPRRGEPVYVAPAFEAGRARERIAGGEELRVWQENESPYLRVAEVLRDRGLATQPVALDPAARFFVADGLRGALAGPLVDGAPIVNACRGRKDAKEIALMRRANEITEAAIARALSGLGEGQTQADLAQAVAAAHVAQGAAPGWALVLFGPNAAYPHGTDATYQLRKGDLVLMDCGTDVHGYQSDITRTVAFGAPPSDRQRKAWTTVQRAQQVAFATARPGVACGAVDRAARVVIEEAGFGAGYASFTHRLGHGIGMDGHEWPYLVEGNPQLLEPGMTCSDEPGIYLVGELGVRLEDIIHVTEDGCELLSHPMAEIEVVGGGGG